MGQNKLRLCTLCARGGSKGVKGKNLRTLMGKPLIAHSIEQAKKSGLFEKIAVSSDSQEILDAAKRFGADLLILRPLELASDTAGKLPAIRHAALEAQKLTGSKYETFVDLDCTSPLRALSDIRDAVQLLESSGSHTVITGAPAHRSPYFNLVEERADGTVGLAKVLDRPILRRQDAPRCFDMNASIYVWSAHGLLEREGLFHADTRLLEMPQERSPDIDSELDFEWVEYLAKTKGLLGAL